MSRAQPKTGWPAIHGGVLLVSLILVLVCLPAMKWPWYLLLPFAVYGCIVLLVPPLRRTTEWLSAGRLNGMGFLAAMVLSVLTAAVLIAYESLFHPNLTTLAASLPVASFNSIVWAGVCFSVVNAILEEFIFRGVFYGALAAEWGSAVAILVTALCFGLSHLHGYPPGPLGAALAGLYGIALGFLRWWSGGLGLTIGTHVSADATIFSILASVGAFSELSR